MTKTMFRVFAAVAMALAGSQTLLLAQGNHNLEGTWDVNVTVVNCQSGALIRAVRSLQMFSHDGSFTETANTFLRGSSLGSWDSRRWRMSTPRRTGSSGTTRTGRSSRMAEGLNKEELSGDGSHFTASGTVTDYDATGNVISVGCVTHAARRLISLDR